MLDDTAAGQKHKAPFDVRRRNHHQLDAVGAVAALAGPVYPCST
jgi:hypothetical protein